MRRQSGVKALRALAGRNRSHAGEPQQRRAAQTIPWSRSMIGGMRAAFTQFRGRQDEIVVVQQKSRPPWPKGVGSAELLSASDCMIFYVSEAQIARLPGRPT